MSPLMYCLSTSLCVMLRPPLFKLVRLPTTGGHQLQPVCLNLISFSGGQTDCMLTVAEA